MNERGGGTKTNLNPLAGGPPPPPPLPIPEGGIGTGTGGGGEGGLEQPPQAPARLDADAGHFYRRSVVERIFFIFLFFRVGI